MKTKKSNFVTSPFRSYEANSTSEKANETQTAVQVDMMEQTGDFSVCNPDGVDARVLQMNYAGEKFSMVIILPNKKDGLLDVQKSMETFNSGNCGKKMEGKKMVR